MRYAWLILIVLIVGVATGYTVVWLSPFVFGQQPAGESITPIPQPTKGTIPPMTPFPPIAPQTDRAYVPIAFAGGRVVRICFTGAGQCR